MKQTEIGLIPDDWKEHTLRDLIDILTDYTANGSFESLARNVRYLEYPSYARLIRLTDIRTNFTNEGVYVSKYSYDFLKKSSLHGGELLLANVGAYAGFSFIYPENLMFRGTLGPNMFLIKFFNQKIDNTFAYYAFSHGAVYNQLISKAASSAQPKLNKEDVRTCYINIPSSMQEQQRIAKALSDVDALISTTEKLIQKKKNIKQGSMQNLLTSKKRLPGFAKSTNYKQSELGLIPEDWEVKSLGELFDMKAGGDVDKEHFSYCKSSLYKYKIFSNGLENEGIYGYTDLPKYKGNAITITGRGTVGIAMFREEDFDAVIRLLVLNSKNDNLTNNSYITEEINSCISFPNESTGVPQLTVPQIRDIVIALPSKEEQTAIANVLSSMDKEIETLNTKLEKYRNLKTAMMQQLLTGKIRLVK